ncbi:MAG: hypothetical protein RLN70_07865, partial [Rhodospirillaceae bacterium]
SFPWHGDALAALAGAVTWAAMIISYRPTLEDYGRNPWEGLILPLVAALYTAITVDSAIAHGRRRGGHWKGRHYGPSSRAPNLSKSP